MSSRSPFRQWVVRKPKFVQDKDNRHITCTVCDNIIPVGNKVEALPPRLGRGWKDHRCFPACSEAPPSAPPTPITPAPARGPDASRQDHDERTPQREPTLSRGGDQAEGIRGDKKRHGDPSRRVVLSPTKLEFGGKRTQSSLNGGSGSGSNSGSNSGSTSGSDSKSGKLSRPGKKTRTTADVATGGGAAVAGAEANGGGTGGKSGGGVACNLAAIEGWTQQTAPASVAVAVKMEPSAAKSTGNNVPAGLPAAATPVAAGNNVPAGVPAQRPSRSGGDGRVSVSQIFRTHRAKYNLRTAGKVGKRARKMFIEEYGKAAVTVLRKRPALDGNLKKVSSPWGPGYVPENAYPSRYLRILEEAYDHVLGRAR